MYDFKTDKIRNVTLIGHTGEGKTTLAEAMLFNAGATNRFGNIVDGTTVMDFDDEEIRRKISINMGIAYMPWRDCKINLIDTPGFFDFEGEVAAALEVSGAAIIVASACGQVTVGTERAVEELEKHKLPGLLFINQVEKENYNFKKTLAALSEAYPKKFAPIAVPIIENDVMTGYVKVIDEKAFELDGTERAIPEYLVDIVPAYKENLTELAAESDDALLEKYFSGQPLSDAEIVSGLKSRQLEDGIILVIGGNAINNKGVTLLMDEIIHCVRSPLEVPPRYAVDSFGNTMNIPMDSSLPASVFVFKTVADPFFGKLSVFKVMSGSIYTGSTVHNIVSDRTEKFGSLYVLKGKMQDAVGQLVAGDIGAAAKLMYTSTGDTLSDQGHKVRFSPMEFPKEAICMAVNATYSGDEEKIMVGLHKLIEEDPTLRIEKHADTGETLLYGVGETQLEVVARRLRTKYKVEMTLATPKIPYRETIRKKVEEQGKHKKQSGGHGQYGDVSIRFEPNPSGGFVFLDEIVGGVVPKSYIPAVEKGLREMLQEGAFGYPMTDIKCTLFFGSYHDVDSSEQAFKSAAHLAYKKMLETASPVLLEPIQTVSVNIPESFLGEILGDISKRRGRILGMESDGGKQIVNAEIPLAELSRYATELRSMTRGKGGYSMQFARYEEAPPMR